MKDLAYRFLNRKPFKSLLSSDDQRDELTSSIQNEMLAEGYDPEYYFGENSSFDLPYDFYRPDSTSTRTQIDFLTKQNQVVELSQVSALVQSLTGVPRGEQRLYYPREVLHTILKIPEADLTPDQEKIIAAYNEETNDVTFNIQQRLF